MDNFENDNNPIDLRALLEKLGDNEKGKAVEKALFRLKTAMETISDSKDVNELGRRCFRDLSDAKKAMGDDDYLLEPFFDMFYGLFPNLEKEDLDPEYEYEDDSEKLEPEFTIAAIIPCISESNPLPRIKSSLRMQYGDFYRIIGGNDVLKPDDAEEDDSDETHFFVQSEKGTLVSIQYVENEDKMNLLQPLLDNTDTELPEEVTANLDGNNGQFIEVYLAPEIGITTSEELSEDGLSNQLEKATMASRLIASALQIQGVEAVFTNGRCYAKDEYIQLVNDLDESDFMPADLFAYTYVQKVENDEVAIMTMGLQNYGFLELIAITSDDDLEREEMFCAIQDFVPYILKRGTAIRDGEVLSFNGRTRYRFTFENMDEQAVFRVRRLRPESDVDVFSMNSEYHGPISWNRYEGLTCPLSFYWNEKKIMILFHVPGCEASYEGYMNEYQSLLDNITFIFEGIKDYFRSPEALSHPAIRKYMRRNGVIGKYGAPEKEVIDKLLSLKPTDIFLDPTVDTLKDGAPLLTVRYRERKNSRSYIEIGIDGDVQLSGVASI